MLDAAGMATNRHRVGATLIFGTQLLCYVAFLASVADGHPTGNLRHLQQLQTSTECPLRFLSRDIEDTISVCAQGNNTVSPSRLLKVSCCTRIRGLVYQTRVRFANVTDQLLMTEAASRACAQGLEASLLRAGLAPTTFAECDVDFTSTWQPVCGATLTTVTAFNELTDYLYPGATTSAACWGRSDCNACVASVNGRVAALQDASGTNISVSASCQELAQIALVAASYPLTISNSIAMCLWNVVIEPLPQSGTCTTFDFETVDWAPALKTCGPKGAQGEHCCDVIMAMLGLVVYDHVNKTGVVDFQSEALACAAAFRAALAARGLSSALYETCGLSTFLGLYSIRCRNYSASPAALFESVEAACAPGVCDLQQDCTSAVWAAAGVLAGPKADQTQIVSCGSFFVLTGWPRFGPGGFTERLNCYWGLPTEVRFRVLEPGHKSQRRVVPVTLAAAAAATIAAAAGAAVLGFVLVRKRRRVRKDEADEDRVKARVYANSGTGALKWYAAAELRTATRDFSETLLLGKGGSGRVFFGELADGTRVAVKRITKPSTTALEDFVIEVSSMASCQHRHILAIKGVHVSDKDAVLVYELMPNGSLSDHLYVTRSERFDDKARTPVLDWPTRLRIAQGTAKGLTYLHEDCKPRIIHRDVKPSNILLDSDMEVKVGDFGLAKFTMDDDTHVSTGVRGTWGFLAPEYVATGKVSEKSDVYAFGVVVLSLVTGRRPTESSSDEEQVFLLEWAWSMAERGELLRLVDPALTPVVELHRTAILTALHVGLLCVHTVVDLRPTMRECLAMLSNQMEIPPLPPKPATLFTISSGSANHGASYTLGSVAAMSLTTAYMSTISMSEDFAGKGAKATGDC